MLPNSKQREIIQLQYKYLPQSQIRQQRKVHEIRILKILHLKIYFEKITSNYLHLNLER